MSICYPRTQGRPDYHVDLSRHRATEGYLRHYENYLTLSFIQQTTRDRREKQEATEELDICERKMRWMANHPNYDHQEAIRGVERLKKLWKA